MILYEFGASNRLNKANQGLKIVLHRVSYQMDRWIIDKRMGGCIGRWTAEG